MRVLDRLAGLKPEIIASMQGLAYLGDGESAVRDLEQATRDVLA